MTTLLGTNLAAGIVPFTDADTYATHSALYGKGGLRTVADTTERDAIPLARQEVGMEVYVISTSTKYRLTATGSPPTWTTDAAGTGTVTSVALSMPTIFTVAGSPVTDSGTLTATLNAQTANTVFAGPAGGAANVPGFRFLDVPDIPDLSGVYTVLGHSHEISDVTGLQTALDGKQAAGSYAAAVHSHVPGDITGLDTTDVPEGTNLYYTDARADARITKAKIETVLTGTISSHNHSGTYEPAITVLGVTKGGTGLSAIAQYSLLYASAANTLAALAPNTASAKRFLTMTGTGAAGAVPGWAAIVAGDIPDLSATYLTVTTATSTYAPLASPALTGTPTAPTAAAATNNTQIATTAFVKAQGYLTSVGTVVNTFNTRSGTVTLTKADVEGVLTGAITSHTHAYAPTASPTFTGTAAFANLTMNRNAGANGQLWYSTAYTSWQNYMGPAGINQGVSQTITAPAGTLVTSWALRSFIENSAGYGWTWESGASTSTTPAIVAELSSVNGDFRTIGTISSSNIHASTSGTTAYIRLSNGTRTWQWGVGINAGNDSLFGLYDVSGGLNRLTVDTSGNLSLLTGGLKINSTTVIDTNRYIYPTYISLAPVNTTMYALRSIVSGEATHRFAVHANGTLYWGSGSVEDVSLYRASANTLMLDHTLAVLQKIQIGSLSQPAGHRFTILMDSATKASNYAYYVQCYTGATGEANPTFAVLGNGQMYWGAGGASGVDVDLFRDSAGVLKTNSKFSAASISLSAQPGVRAYKSASQTITANGWTQITFDQESYDNLGEFNTTNSRFTPTTSGIYLVSISCLLSSYTANTRVILEIQKGGVSYQRLFDLSSSGTWLLATGYAYVKVTSPSTEYITAHIYSVSNNVGTDAGSYSVSFAVQKLA